MRGLSENLQCKNHYFLTKWWDPLDLSKQKILLDLVYMHPGGVRTASDLFFIWKSAIMKHPNADPYQVLGVEQSEQQYFSDNIMWETICNVRFSSDQREIF